MIKILPSSKKDSCEGQILLIVLLIMTVVLTIGLAIATRSVTDIKISTETEEASRAFSAAEAGIEQVLVTESNAGGQFSETGASFQAAATGLGEGQNVFAFPDKYNTDESPVLWLSDNNTLAKVYDRSQLRIVWGLPQVTVDSSSAALEASLFYNDNGSYRIARFTLDPYTSRSPGPSFCVPPASSGDSRCQGIVSNSFTIVDEVLDGKQFHFGATLDLSPYLAGVSRFPLLVRLRFLYAVSAQPLGAGIPAGLPGIGTFPSQGLIIDSIGQAGKTTRKVEVSRLHPAPPFLFDFALYSGGDLVK